MHGNSLRGVSLTRTAHPAGLGPLAEAGRVAVAGPAPAGAVHPIAMVRAATATGTRHRSRNRPRGRDIGPTPSQTLTPREIGANRPMNHTVPQRPGHGQIPGPPIPAPPGAGPPLPDLLPAGTCEVVATGVIRPDPNPSPSRKAAAARCRAAARRTPFAWTDRDSGRPRLAHVLAAPGGFPDPASTGTASSSPAPCRATVHPRTGALRLVFEQRSGYLNDQALTSRNESMITATHAVTAPQTSLRYQLAAETISPFSLARQQACQVATATSEPLPIDSTAALKARQTDRMPARP